MKQAYKDYNPSAETKQTIILINQIIRTYQQQGYKLSVRQLYYQLVARDLIPNTERSYKRIASIINDGRVGGLIDWDAIEDRNRDIEMRNRWESGGAILSAVAEQFHMDMWQGQENRLFVIVEKAALAGVLERTCREHDVPMLAARGYPSVSIVREMVLEHFMPAWIAGQNVVVLHLGDHDPSGIDMTRDLWDRMEMFAEEWAGHFAIERIALNRDQIDRYKPPPNPAKQTDARFGSYAREHGGQSWELDALQPQVLVDMVTNEILQRVDPNEWARRADKVDDITLRLRMTAEQFDEAA